MIARTLALVVASVAAASVTSAAGSRSRVQHRIRKAGVTYADLAEHYYGKRYLERHLRAVNARPEPLEVGTRITIPTARTVSVAQTTSARRFARKHLQSGRRAAYLLARDGLRGPRLRAGARVTVGATLTHLVRPGESLAAIARAYYREAASERLPLLRLYNQLGGSRPPVGARIVVPLDTPEFERRRVSARTAVPLGKAPAPDRRPADPANALETAARQYEDGHYEEARRVAETTRKMHPEAPAALRAELLRIEASSLVALDRVPDARMRFAELRALSRGYELDLYRTSPKLLDVFASAAP